MLHMRIKVSKNAKLPLKICKGSVKSRLELARHYNNEFFNSIFWENLFFNLINLKII